MPRVNKTEYAVLGCLTIEPMSGYDMREFIKKTFSYFWHESYGQLYPTLKRLHDRGLVKRKIEHHVGSPDRHVYSITPNGREHLLQWLNEETTPAKVRQETLLKIFFGPEAGVDVITAQIEDYIAKQRAKLEIFEGLEKTFKEEYGQYEHWAYWFTTLRYGIHIARARLKWGKESIKLLREEVAAPPAKAKK